MKKSQLTLALALSMTNMFADSTGTLENLQNKLIELKEEANSIQARADAEKRELTADEEKEIEQIFASFEKCEADIERRERIDSINAKVATPGKRRTEPDDLQNRSGGDGGGREPAQPKRRTVIEASDRDLRGKWGFRSSAEFLSAVLASSQKGGSIDPRLVANAPTTYGSEGVGADGGFAVPPDFRTTIMQKVMGEDSLLSMTDQNPVSGNSLTFPADETTPWQSSGGIQAYWENEGGKKTESKPQLVEKTVKANKIIALVPMTDELLEDAPAMASYVNRKAPEKITFKVNDAIINGTGVGQPLGILSSPGTIVVPAESGQAADSIVYANITKLWGRLTPSARRGAVWIANPDIEEELMNMSFPGTGTAVPVYLPPGGLSESPYGKLLGRPIITTEAAPALGDAGDLMFGNMASYLSVVKSGGIRQDISIHVWFDYDITAFRFVLRIGGQPWWNTPIDPYHSGGKQRGFFAALGARD